MALSKVNFVNGPLEVFTVQDDKQEDWMAANPFAEVLKYSRPNKAIQQHVSAKNQKTLEEMRSHCSGALTSSLHPQTKFINTAGVFELIDASEMPAAKRFKQWNTNDLLPTLCAEGEYSMSKDAPSDIALGMNAVHVATNGGREAPWMKDLEEFKVVLTEKDRKIDKLTNALIESNEKNNTLTQALIAVTERTDKLANRIIDLAQDVVTKPNNPQLLHSLAVCSLGGDQYAFLRPQKRNLKRSLNRLSVDNREIVFKSEYVPNAMNVLNKVKENLPRDKFKARHRSRCSKT
ncbi:BRO-H [Olene mendosa nucleopolyhedrovirus]|uniref:BRO-H n=1 Tax=Olene mendosa nucleopolyhedrovirus TaxID=2933796 RepID=A0AAX3AVH4_9ABAC|nr:BRO-H [Olene mendosa nucleopolyhedrovirus]UOQ18920.1 BRO-H [Olene mendosa nucleopolyhedrovirus]